MRLIDASELQEEYKQWHDGKRLLLIDVAPTVDAVPVVRCGECKYLMPDNHCTMFADDRIRPSSSDFCSAGERRDGDGNG